MEALCKITRVQLIYMYNTCCRNSVLLSLMPEWFLQETDEWMDTGQGFCSHCSGGPWKFNPSAFAFSPAFASKVHCCGGPRKFNPEATFTKTRLCPPSRRPPHVIILHFLDAFTCFLKYSAFELVSLCVCLLSVLCILFTRKSVAFNRILLCTSSLEKVIFDDASSLTYEQTATNSLFAV